MSVESDLIRNNIMKIAEDGTEKQTRSCFRVYKAVVKTAPNTSTGLCGVSFIGDETVLNLPFTTATSTVSVGDIVLVATTFNSFSNAVVWAKADLNGINKGLAGYELVGAGLNNSPVWKQPSGYLTCSTLAAATAKTAACTNFQLVVGAMVIVKFTYAHTSILPATLNVNSTGAKTIVWHNTGYSITQTSTSNATKRNSWQANEILTLVYDGTYWRIIARTNPTFYSATGTVAAVVSDFVEIANFTVAAGKIYTVSANVQSSVSADSTVNCVVEVYDSSGTYLSEYQARTNMTGGGGATVSAVLSTVSQSNYVTLRLKSYGYYNGTYNLSGYLNAVSVVE